MVIVAACLGAAFIAIKKLAWSSQGIGYRESADFTSAIPNESKLHDEDLGRRTVSLAPDCNSHLILSAVLKTAEIGK